MDEHAERALAELTGLADLPRSVVGGAEITGADPVLPVRYRIGAAGAAAQAACGMAAAEIWRQRTGQSQTVRVDLPAATVALRSSKYMTIDGRPARGLMDPLSGFYPTRDGRHVFLHANFENLRNAAAAVLGAGQDRAAFAAACARWDAEALETALHEGGACGAFVRTHAEWDAHPHAAAVAALPVLEIVRIGDAPPETLPASGRPLSGVRVLDLTRVIAGPTCARTLAEHGADVLRITRADLPDSGELDLDTGIGKLSAELDLRDPAQAERLRELARGAHVFSQSYRPGTLAARGFSPEDLARLRPGIVYVTLSAWSHAGPWNRRRGYDTIVQATTGIAAAHGGPSGPRTLPVSAIDYVSGNLLAYGAMIALARRAEQGGSWLVRTSLAQVGRWIVQRGTLPQGAFEQAPNDLPAARIAALCAETDAPDGRIRYLAPVVRMSETEARWTRPPAPLGAHPAAWP